MVTVLPLTESACTANSSAFNAVRASPFANAARARIVTSSIFIVSPGKPERTARSRIASRSCSRSWSRVNTRQRDSRAETTSKLGFSVVAPISVMIPCST